MERTCKQCGAAFTLTPEEIAFYQSKNLQLPKRCEQCRKENKSKAGHEPVQTVRPYYGQKRDSGKRWAVAVAAVLVLLIAGICIFQSGRLFERSAPGIEIGAEAVETSVQSADAQTEKPKITESEHVTESDDPPPEVQPEVSKKADDPPADAPAYTYFFRKAEYLQEHFEKHGAEFGYSTTDEYLAGANRVIASPEALHKLEAEDGDDVYYLESTNEFVIVSTDGYLRTYFKPDSGKAYFDSQ